MVAYSIVWKKVTNLFKSVKNIFEKNEEFATCQKELEALLISHDVNIKTAQQLVKELPKSNDSDVVLDHLKQELIKILSPCEKQFVLPNVPLSIVLVCGVNGGGKTTTIAKLAQYLRRSDFPGITDSSATHVESVSTGIQNVTMDPGSAPFGLVRETSSFATPKKIGFVAADTFRAAAIDQLQIWGKRLNTPVYAGPSNSDPASIIYQAIDWAKSLNLEVLLIDTAGRLQNKKNLMDELAKIRRVIQKQIPDAPHETILVLDGTTGSNIITQTETFHDITPLTGIIMTKLDGTAKGGGLVSIAALFQLPIYFLGTGEKETDLEPFGAEVFMEKLLYPTDA